MQVDHFHAKFGCFLYNKNKSIFLQSYPTMENNLFMFSNVYLHKLLFLKGYKISNGILIEIESRKMMEDIIEVIKIINKNITFEKINKSARVVIIDEQEFLEITEKNFKGF